MNGMPPPSEWDHRAGDVRSANPLAPDVLEAIAGNPIAAGSEPDAQLLGCVVLSLWQESSGEGRLTVQPHGELLRRDALMVVAEQLHDTLALGRDGEAPGRDDAG